MINRLCSLLLALLITFLQLPSRASSITNINPWLISNDIKTEQDIQSITSLQAVQTTTEDFSTFSFAGMTDHTRWDIWNRSLELDRLDAPAQAAPKIVGVGNGESIVVWADERNGDTDIYAQRIDSRGNRLWQNDLRVNSVGNSAWQNSPNIASNGSGTFVIVWRDGRNNRADLYAQRVDLNGSLLWSSDRLINVDTGIRGKESPCLAINNSGQILIAWQDDRSAHEDIYAQRFDLNGNRMWPNDLRINTDTGTEYQQFPSITADLSDQFIITWSDRRNNGDADIYAQRIDANGNRAWGNDIRVSSDSGSGWQSSPVIAGIGGGLYMLAWEDNRNETTFQDIYAQVINASGTRLLAQDLRVNGSNGFTWEGRPAIASEMNGQAQIAWMDGRSGYQQVYTQHIDQSGTRLLAQDIHISTIEERSDQESPAIAMTGSNSATIVWTGDSDFNTDIFSQSINQTGNRSWPTDKRVSAGNGTAQQVTPAIAADPAGNAVVVWRDLRNESCAIYAQALDSSGNRLWKADQHIANVRYCQATDDTTITANTSGNFLIVWSDGDIFAQLLDISGNRLWPSNLVISAGPYLRESPAAAALTNGDFIITWVGWGTGIGETSIFAQRVDTLGTIHWPGDRQVNSVPDTSRQFAPAVTADSSGSSIIVWQDQRNQQNGTSLYDIYAQRLDIDGNRTWINDLQVSDPNNSEHNDPQITGIAGGRFIVTWQDPRLFNSYGWDIFAQRIDSNRTRAWTNDLRVNTDSNNTYQGTPMIISNADGQALVAWTDNRNGNVQIYAQRMDATGKHIWASDMQATKESKFTGEYFISSTRDQNGNAIIAWQDARFGNGDTFIQKMGTDGVAVWSADLQLTKPDYFYFSEGAAQSSTVAMASSNIRSATLTSNYQANSGTVQFSLSNNGGTTWEAVTPGINHIFISTGKELRWMINLNADPAWSRSPVVNSVNIEYSTDEIGADPYENDNTCDQARVIALNGAIQQHNFHQATDVDWVKLNVVEGKSYIIQTSQTEANADTRLSYFRDCAQPALGSNENAYGREARFSFTSIYTGLLYIKISNQVGQPDGQETGYSLSARLATTPPVVVIVSGHDDSYSLQSNIDYSADLAYRTFVNNGVPKVNIRYFAPNPNRDVDSNGLNDDIAGLPEPLLVKNAIQDWSKTRGVSLGVPFFLYLVDHGNYDQFLANGTNGKITANDLDLWLSNLESTSGADQVNVIIEACHSGSFIDQTSQGPAKISGHNRVIIASTSSALNAYPSPLQGSYFSDAFWTAFGGSTDLMTAFEQAKQAVQATNLNQQPWVDDNGDGVANNQDGALARSRGLNGAFAGSAPVIDLANVTIDEKGTGKIIAQIRDDFGIDKVWVQIFEPGFVEPPPTTDGSIPVLNTPILYLDPDTSETFQQSYSFTKTGVYRLVVYATDFDSNSALPYTILMVNGNDVFLPMIVK